MQQAATQRFRGVALALALCAPAPATAGADSAALRFLRSGEEVARVELGALRQTCREERVEVADPYYGRTKCFFALPALCVLERGFGAPLAAGDNLFLRAADGYTRATRAEPLRRGAAWLAFADASLTPSPEAPARWEPIDRREVHPGPFYMIWSGAGQNDPHRYPWPYQLVAIDAAPLEREYPHLSPGRGAGAEVRRGFDLFRDQCVSCHAINGEGGKVGPDLNIPQSIVEYRPVNQIRAYIRDPGTFRRTSMPAHRHLSDADLDALVSYFRAMAQRKHLPGDES